MSLKKFFMVDGIPHTYGGFGDYVEFFLEDYDEVHLCVPLCPFEIPGGYPLLNEKIKYHFLPYYKTELGLALKWPVIFFRLLVVLRDADVVNARIPDFTGVCGWIVGRILKKPIFVSVQSDIELLLNSVGWTRTSGLVKLGLYFWLKLYLWFERRIMVNTLCFVQGQRLMDKYKNNGEMIVQWVSSAIGISDLRANLPIEEIFKKKIINLLIVARVTAQKDHRNLLNAVKIIRDTSSYNVQLTIVGKVVPKIYNELVREADEKGILGAIRFLDLVDHGEELWRLYDSADIFVLSSLWEGTPKVLLEAQARSLPVVSTSVGGVPTVISDGSNGFLCEPSDSEALARVIIKVIELPLENLRSTVEQGLVVAKEYTKENQKQALISKLSELNFL